MRVEDLRIGMKVRHPGYGSGEVVSIDRHTCEILFDDGQKRTVSPQGSGLGPMEPQAEVTGLTVPLESLIRKVASGLIERFGIEDPSGSVDDLLQRWQRGTMILKPEKDDLAPKEIPMETFFHKIVMVRNQLRVLEQKVNSHPRLEEAEKVELQAYITRCYGSLTTFNLLFRDRDSGFGKN